ncbi:GyrI-like domain-containing protein [Saccharothrix longispora]|uniref:GyrI-like domain-containing protein n=1 Tax=Saccharothrix longispora TaxID=33920 RepID=UPI0028FDC066|nr:GyrI-like domain-containing protein [Saccharothrix longispora]MDU0290639.1 GyrI-like domain-containing protein [Saccharothrix longispora]
MPLPVVAAVLSGAPGALDDVRAEHEAELVRRRSALAALERVMVEGLPATPVRVVAEPARSVAVVREVAAGAADVSRATSAAVARVLREVPPTGPPELIGLFPVELDDAFEVRVALVVGRGSSERHPSGRNASGWEASGWDASGWDAELLPGGEFACATHVGPYDQIPLTVHALLAWCAERGHPLRGPIREVYVSDPATTEPDRLVTHLMIPLEERP